MFTKLTALLGKQHSFCYQTHNPLQQRITELEAQNHDLQLQIKTLERALELVGKKG